MIAITLGYWVIRFRPLGSEELLVVLVVQLAEPVGPVGTAEPVEW